jgi:hypothetical protein
MPPLRQLTLPHDPLPQADAMVAIGHPLSHHPDAWAIDQALIAIAAALRPGGVLALDICDLEWGCARLDTPHFAHADEDWAIITKFSMRCGPVRSRHHNLSAEPRRLMAA